MLRECVLLVAVYFCGVGSLDGRGFFCRDPDTGKLHAVNATWPAISFCGNYHCRLKRKNITSTQYAPTRQVNITNIQLLGKNFTAVDIENGNGFLSEEKVQETTTDINNTTEPDSTPRLKGETGFLIDDIDDKNETDKDRYLSDSEIRTLTEILHSVKKSDLDAIVEIYNLAQDIYKEIDKTSTDSILQETLNTAKTVENRESQILEKVIKNAHVSYWYEPLHGGKLRPAEIVRSVMAKSETLKSDIVPSLPVPAPVDTAPAASSQVNVGSELPVLLALSSTSSTLPPAQLRRKTDTFFNGPLSQKDFGKLPYYYPISSFQRIASYKHNPKDKKIPKVAQLKTQPPKINYKTNTYRPVYTGGKYQKEIKPSILLPYPFYNIHHYNWSAPQNLYNRNLIFDKSDSRKQKKQNEMKIQRKPNNAVLMNPDLENFQDLQVILKGDATAKSMKIQEERRKPEWQTDQLPKQILDEVRAHIPEKQKLFINPFPLRKKVKLERVGKLIRMDEVARTKRMAEKTNGTVDNQLKPELYEVFIERTTCNADLTVPGYFRYGNLSQPFPECCPQRISTR